MPIQTDPLNRKLYDLLDTRGYKPIPKDSDVSNAGKTVAPEEADVFRFTFTKDGEKIDDAWITVDGSQNLVIYYDQDITKNASAKTPGSQFDDSWYGLLNHLKKWAHSRQLSFKLEPKEKLDSDMAQRTYMKKKENVSEGYYPMGKQASYSDAIPTVKIVLQHTRQIQEGEQRFRNIARIFLENTQGERILCPFNRPGMAQVYARHLAEGGKPNDDRWNHVTSLCEEYSKMAGFARAVKNGQFNESAQKLVEAGVNHFITLRESLGKMRGHRGYNAYFESWTPALMEAEGDEPANINELFVQETLDPRIESVMPILSKLSKNLGEMKEVSELAEWADNLTELAEPEPIGREEYVSKKKELQRIQMDPETAKSPALRKEVMKKLAQLQLRAKQSGFAVAEEEGVAEDSSKVWAVTGTWTHRKNQREPFTTTTRVVANSPEEAMRKYKSNMWQEYERKVIDMKVKPYKGQGSTAVKIDEQGVAEGEIEDAEQAHKKISMPAAFRKAKGGDWRVTGQDLEKEKARTGTSPEGLAAIKKLAGVDQQISEVKSKTITINPKNEQELVDWLDSEGFDVPESTTDENGNLVYDFKDMDHSAYVYASDFDVSSEEADDDLAEQGGTEIDLKPNHFYLKSGYGNDLLRINGKNLEFDNFDDAIDFYHNLGGHEMDEYGIYVYDNGKLQYVDSSGEIAMEGLDANQKRVGQLGPTEKVKNNNIGKLVGANESVELSEMDKSQPSSDRGGESSGDPYAKGGKATPVKSKDMDKDAEKTLNKSMDKAYKKDVKEGQEDLEAILRIIRK